MDPYEAYAQRASRDHVDTVERRILERRSAGRTGTGLTTARSSKTDWKDVHEQLFTVTKKQRDADGWEIGYPIERFCEILMHPLPKNVNSFVSWLRTKLYPFNEGEYSLRAGYFYAYGVAPRQGSPVVAGKTTIYFWLQPTSPPQSAPTSRMSD
jgi:hypothetical protein